MKNNIWFPVEKIWKWNEIKLLKKKECCNKSANIDRKEKWIHENVDDETIKDVCCLKQSFEFRFKRCLIIENVYEQNYYTTWFAINKWNFYELRNMNYTHLKT